MKWMVTGGAGFIGSTLVRRLLSQPDDSVINVDKITYASAPESLAGLEEEPRYIFSRQDICDRAAIDSLLAEHQPDAVFHLAAETHVDRSIDAPGGFVATNVVGTFTVLDSAAHYWRSMPPAARDRFRFVHVSTDEVFGPAQIGETFTLASPYRPSSPYAASKAAADHLARAWSTTFGLPLIVTHCSNNVGSFQHPEKLIPRTIVRCLEGKPIPIFGDGAQQRDWLYVDDHVAGIAAAADAGLIGSSYMFATGVTRSNNEVVHAVCGLLDELSPESRHRPHHDLISHVPDRPGHDFRYAIDPGGSQKELGWTPAVSFAAGLRDTVLWYLGNHPWWRKRLDNLG